jgi:NhaP-type Na+/H+ or K+/H+ antiporter
MLTVTHLCYLATVIIIGVLLGIVIGLPRFYIPARAQTKIQKPQMSRK